MAGVILVSACGGDAQPVEQNAAALVVRVAAPVVTSPAGPVTVNAATFTITGTASTNTLVSVWVDVNRNGIRDRGDTLAGVQLLLGKTATRYSITVTLKQDAVNAFIVTAIGFNDGRLESGSTGVPLITEDSKAPDTLIVSGPTNPTFSADAPFTFTSSEPGSSFACQLDGAPFSPCTSPRNYPNLTAGAHAFAVRATDGAGNIDPTPATATWTITAVDSTPPETTISAGPADPTTASDATFTFVSTEPGSTFACQVDDTAFTLCTSPQTYLGLTAGVHRFSVQATDLAGNADPTPATFAWTILDTAAPDTFITSGPANPTTSTDATFAFAGTEAGSTFACQLDGAVFVPCTSPKSYTALATGSHTFAVAAADPAGNVDPTPATFAWTITPPPTPQCGNVDDGNACTVDACDPATGTVTHTPIANCDPVPTGDGSPFETRAALMGLVSLLDGTPVTSYTLTVYDIPIIFVVPRTDVALTTASDGSFKLRLTSFPDTEPERSPAHHVLVLIEAPEILPIRREVALHPGSIVDLGRITAVRRDPNVTVVDAAGGTASDSRGLVEVVFPPGALAQATPIRITPALAREEVPAPLPDVTATTYAFEIEPSGLQFPASAQPTVRVLNWRNLPTTLPIPAGVFDEASGFWLHAGIGSWDGTRFAFKVKHTSVYDLNIPILGQWVIVIDDEDPLKSCTTKCGSETGGASGTLRQTIAAPSYRRRNSAYDVALNYDSALTLGPVASPPAPQAASYQAVPLTSVAFGFQRVTARMTCVHRGGGGGGVVVGITPGTCAQASAPGGAGGGAGGACVIGGSGTATVPPFTWTINGSLGQPITRGVTPGAGSLAEEITIPIRLPLGADGQLPRPGFIVRAVSLQSGAGTACVGGGAGFGVMDTTVPPVVVPTSAAPPGGGAPLPGAQPIAGEYVSTFVLHRHGSPFGVGWGVDGVHRLYRNPVETEAVLVHGSGDQERFRPWTIVRSITSDDLGDRAFARDPLTHEILGAQTGQGIYAIDPSSGVRTPVLPAVVFPSAPQTMAVTYIAGIRHLVIGCTGHIIDVSVSGAVRVLIARPPPVVPPTPNDTSALENMAGVAASGEWAFYAEGATGPTAQVLPRLVRFHLTDPVPAAEQLALQSGGDIALDPLGAVSATTFGEPKGLAMAADGGLYVADRRRSVVYEVLPNAAGLVAPDSLVVRVAGDGVGRQLPRKGKHFIGRAFSLNQPFLLSTTEDGALLILNPVGIARFDARSFEAEWLFAGSSNGELTQGLMTVLSSATPFVATGATSALVATGTATIALVTRTYASEDDPTRALVFSPQGATLEDTTSDLLEAYDASGRLVDRRTRAGDPILAVSYLDATSDRIDRILDPTGGGFFKFTYDAAGKVATVTDHVNRTTRVTIDAFGDVSALQLPEGETYTFQYQAHRMTQKTNPRGEITTYTYAPDGTLKTSAKPTGEIYSFTSANAQTKHDARGELVHEGSFVDPHGVNHVLTVDARGQPLSEQFTADGVSYTVEHVKAGKIGGFDGDSVFTRRNTLGRDAFVMVNGTVVTPQTDWDELGRPRRLYPAGPLSGIVFKTWTYDVGGRLSAFSDLPTTSRSRAIERDAQGRLTRVSEASPGPGLPPREVLVSYRPDGLPATLTAHGVATTFTYDPITSNLSSSIDTLGRQSLLTYDDAGNLASRSDGRATSTFTYDVRGRLKTSSDAAGNPTTFEYAPTAGDDRDDRVTFLHTPDLLTASDGWRFDYLPGARLKTVTAPDGSLTTYDYELTGELRSVLDPLGRLTSFKHDAQGRVAAMTDALNRSFARTYAVPTPSGWSGATLLAASASTFAPQSSLTAALGAGAYQIGTNGFDATPMQTPTASVVTRSEGLPQVSLYRDATFALSYGHLYDSSHRPVIVQDRGALPIDSTVPFDPVHPDATAFVVQSWDGQHQDVLTNLSSTHAGPGGGGFSSYSYNTELDLVGSTGWFNSVTGGISVQETYSRDTGGRLTAIDPAYSKALFGGLLHIGPTTTYTYTPEGRPASSTTLFPPLTNLGWSVTYDTRGLVATRTGRAGTYTYTYDKLGRVALVTYPDGHVREQQYDTQGRIFSRCYNYALPAASRCYTATYDAVGNPRTLVDPEGTDLYEYDALDRLTKASRHVQGQPDEVSVYTYNSLGALATNGAIPIDARRPALVGGALVDSAVPQSVDGLPVALDAAGRITQVEGTTLSWNKNGSLEFLTDGTNGARFGYDASGRIIGVEGTIGGQPVSDVYVYDGPNESLIFSATTLAARAWFEYDGLDQPLFMARFEAPAADAFFEVDLAGNVRHLRAPGGADLGGYRYGPFGDVREKTAQIDQPFQWKGRPFLALAGGITQMRARWWSPRAGNFLSIDNYEFQDATTTLWGWPGQNATRYSDPSGRYANVTVNGNDVYIVLPMDYTGPAATPAQIARINRLISKAWTRKVGKYNVRTTAVQISKKSQCPTSQKNSITLTKRYTRSVVLSETFDDRNDLDYLKEANRGTWWAYTPDADSEFAHEAGHLMGLPDLYIDDPNSPFFGTALPGAEQNIMFDGSMPPVESDIARIIEANLGYSRTIPESLPWNAATPVLRP